MKIVKCPICGSENKQYLKYCRICFSRLNIKENKTLKTRLYKSELDSKIAKQKSVIAFLFVLLLLFLIWILNK